MPSLRPATRRYIATLCAAAVAFVVVGWARSGPIIASLDLAAACAAGVAVAWRFPIRYTYRQHLYGDGAVALIAILLLEPPLACAAVALGAALGNLAASPRDRPQALFNGAQSGLSTALAGLLLAAAGWGRSASDFAEPGAVALVLASIAIHYLANTVFVAAIVGLESRTPISRVWRRTVFREPADALGALALGGLGAMAASVGSIGWVAVLLAAPVIAVIVLLRASLRAQTIAQVALSGMETSLAQVQRIAGIGSFEWELHSGRHLWSDQTYAILGITPEPLPVSHERFLETVHPHDRLSITIALRSAGETGDPLATELRIVRHDGSERVARLQAELAQDGRSVIGVLHDVTAQTTLQATLHHRATHDQLTGIANRTAFLEQFEALLRPGRLALDLSVVYFDLDDFKQVNDTHGHAVGDRLLMEVADRLVGFIRPGDIAARFGGDEFVLLLVGPRRLSEVRAVADRLGDTVRRPIRIDDLDLEVGASIGIASTSERQPPDRLLRDADTALYHAKFAGKNRTVLSASRLIGDLDHPQDRRAPGSRLRDDRPEAAGTDQPSTRGWLAFSAADGTPYEISTPTADLRPDARESA